MVKKKRERKGRRDGMGRDGMGREGKKTPPQHRWK
jgi:hypothetical protein